MKFGRKNGVKIFSLPLRRGDGCRHWSALTLLLLCVTAFTGRAAEAHASGHRFAEPNPPTITATNAAARFSVQSQSVGLSAGPTLYSIGQPTDDEQLYLELINRARANPPAEGQWLKQLTNAHPGVYSAVNAFGSDLDLMITEFNAIPVAPPLAFNADLTDAARLHSALMFTNEVQEHQITSINEPDLGQRALNEGYSYSTLGENIYSYSEDTVYGHAGFQIDWGPGLGGMQNGRGHRVNIHSANFREVGIGVYHGETDEVGPQLVTQDFGRSPADTPFLTGVVYHDLDADQFYDLGEGLGGVTVEVTGNQYYAISAGSGGYTIPLPGDGSYTVTFTAANGGTFTTNVTVTGGANIKVDWRPAYQTPVLTGPSRPVNGFNMTYSFTTPIGITNYTWESISLTAFTLTDNADAGLNNFNATTTSGYSVTGADPTPVIGRSSVFHLVHITGSPVDQILELKNVFIPKPGASLTFQHRLALATVNQVPKVEISQDNGTTWTTVWSQTGGSASQNSPYSLVSIDLGSLAKISTKLRFRYDMLGGSYFPQDTYNVGWCFDDISLTGVDTGSVAGSGTVANGNQFLFTASSSATYLVSLKPSVVGRSYPVANVLQIQSVTAPTLTISGVQPGATKKFDIGFSHAASGQLRILSASSVLGPWNPEAGISLETLTPEQSFRVTLPSFTGHRFYRTELVP